MMRLTAILSYAWSISRSVRLRILAGAVAGVMRIACGLLFIWLSKRLIDIATGDAEGTMLPNSLWLILTVVVETVCSLWQVHLETSTDARLKNTLRHSLFVKVMGSCWDGRERFHTGDVVNRLEEDVRITAETICKTVPGTIVTLCQAIGAFLFLCFLSPVLGWIITGILPLLLLAGKLYTRRMRHLTTDIRTTDSDMREALLTAAADFVELLPQGLDTPCGESGAGLSEGQAQCIAIARGLLYPGKILLLDEFSSALDANTERLLMHRLTTHAAGKTMIFITHRQEIARRCQETIVLNKPN